MERYEVVIRRSLRIIPIAAIALLGACGGEEAPRPANADDAADPVRNVEVAGITVGRGIGPDFRVLQETESFRTLDTIFVSVGTLGVGSAASLTAVWIDPEGGVVERQVKEIAPVGAEATEFHLEPSVARRPGEYRVVILLEDEEVAQATFHILDRP